MSSPAAAAATPAGDGPVPLVSVLVRSLDRPPLAQALASIAGQTHARIEVVVVAVSPGHATLPSQLGPHPLRLLQADAPRPRSVAANVALDAARGDWLLFLDDDDWLMPDHIERLVRAVQGREGALAAYAGVAMVDGDGRPLGQAFDLPFDAVRLLSGNLMPIHAVLFGARLRELGCRFDETLDRYEDWDFWIQVARQTVPEHVPGISAVYRIHSSSGVHGDAGPHGASSQRIYAKWLPHCTPQQLGDLMQRVWSHDELAHRLAHAEAAAAARESALAQALALAHVQTQAQAQAQAATAELAAALQGLRAELHAQAAAAERRHGEALMRADTLAAQLVEQVAHERQRVTRLESELADEAHRSASLLLDNEAMRHSTSWRITRPLRALMALWRRPADAAR